MRSCLKTLFPEVPWPTFVNWKRKHANRRGPAWERLLDGRLPPPPPPIADDIRLAACMLRRADRSVNCARARDLLEAQFGAEGRISDASLKRIWSTAGLCHQPRPDATGKMPGETVAFYNGGGGLALLGAAEAELGSGAKLAAAVQAAGQARAESQGEVEELVEPEGSRDERGRLTSIYNLWQREGVEPGKADARWGTNESKRRHRDLSELPTLKSRPATLASKLLCMGVMPLLTERRGFVGLEGPAGKWLEVLGVHPYMPRTLDKELTELGLLGVDEALWRAHAQQWHEHARRWTEGGPSWLRLAVYVDATLDPYWTRHFAYSGKVSRVGRLMPCLDRVAVTSGPGVPLVMETHAGTVSLKKSLVPLLQQLESWVGEGELGRLTIIDAEMAKVGLLWRLDQELDRGFITVLKGPALESAERRDIGQWQPFRERDEVRELVVVLQGKGGPEGGFEMRGVEMRRPGSRREHPTLFLCNWDEEELPSTEVARAYLSRWPHQEQVFRNGRHGGGLERSHGYGGELVTSVAFETKVEAASRKLDRAKDHLLDVEGIRDIMAEDLSLQSKPTAIQKSLLKTAKGEVRKAERAVVKANNTLVDQCKMPREIYARDPSRDTVMTCLKLNALLLLEFVLKEYFGDLRMEWRTFIEQYLLLAVTVRTSQRRVLYQIHANDRQPQRMAQLREACNAINKRLIQREERLLKFEVIDPASGGS
ncbi:MAG: hypothetical protein GY719_35190 [bacterium]|nr:hypothetical protein [bacterium]